MKKQIVLYLIFIFLGIRLYAQQIPTISQYDLNPYELNPAATGITDRLPISFTFRKLWAGIGGSPSIQYLMGDMEVADAMGAGVKFFNYQAGPVRKTGMEGTYSYHLLLNNAGTKLSFGLSAQVYQYMLNKSELFIEDVDDEIFMGTESMVVPDVSFGIFLYDEKYYAGLAIPQLFNRNIDLKSGRILQQKQVRHFYLHGGYKFNLNDDFRMEPSLLFKFVEAGLFQADINARVTYIDMVSFGLSYRSSDAMVFQLGYKNKDFLINYAFDLTLSPLKTQTLGSHEIILIYTLDNFLR
ncbi:MAG: type IX secretion system membrane protein PorP/SprF [Bacteroidales bacterium]|nr:type IX secretion system membrane protein PorP/SprF [Bacteroidales bacterium]